MSRDPAIPEDWEQRAMWYKRAWHNAVSGWHSCDTLLADMQAQAAIDARRIAIMKEALAKVHTKHKGREEKLAALADTWEATGDPVYKSCAYELRAILKG